MKAILVNFNYTPDWIFDYPDLDYVIYDRSRTDVDYLKDFPKERIIKTKNIGNVDFDKLNYLVENYDTLPDVFLWSKTNIFKYVDKLQLDEALKKQEFKPLLKQDHKTYSDKYGVVCYYKDGMYYERADGWFFNNPELEVKYAKDWSQWSKIFLLPQVSYIPFAPGGSYILTKERVHRYGRDLYEKMASTLPYATLPAEAHACERSYNLLWS